MGHLSIEKVEKTTTTIMTNTGTRDEDLSSKNILHFWGKNLGKDESTLEEDRFRGGPLYLTHTVLSPYRFNLALTKAFKRGCLLKLDYNWPQRYKRSTFKFLFLKSEFMLFNSFATNL